MIESMATGTPVIGMALGAVPEVIAHGKTGFVCRDREKIIEAVPAAMKLDRQTCRDHVVKHFSIKTMVSEYEKAYQWVLGNTAAEFDESDELDE
jgi:glycosyltransferase involved in cell wall biosynthesis